MRNSNIISSIANAFARFSNAGNVVVSALLPVRPSLSMVGSRRLQHPCAGLPVYPTAILPGNPGAAMQMQLLTLGRTSFAEKPFGKGEFTAFYLPTISDRDWQTPGSTRRQTKQG